MNSIAQILNFKKDIESFSSNLHQISSLLNVISLLDNVPASAVAALSNPEFLEVATKTFEYVAKFKTLLSPINKVVHNALYNQKAPKSSEQPYAGFKVDEKPITGKVLIEEQQKQMSIYDFESIKAQYEQEHNKPLRPINRKGNLPYKGDCVFCGAPNSYLYNNNNGQQCLCKACNNTFSSKTRHYDELAYYCPHCKNKLQVNHDRKNCIVYKCESDICPYYLDSLERQKNGDTSLFLPCAGREKLRYRYRAFKFTLDDVTTKTVDFDTKIKLQNAHHSPQTIGLILTLYINYGLSSRKVSMIMKDVFNISISHQTVMNYAEAAACKVQYLACNYKYQLGNIQTADETYIKVSGKTKYVFFYSDPINKIITSWKIYDNRDTRAAVESTLMALNKYDKIPEDLLLITDANPIYNAAQLFLSMYDINFNLQQVVGVSNKDEISVKYRPFKQIEERLNRTYKENYHGTYGYQTLRSANVYMILYVTFFNFLRRHSALNYKAPVELKELENNILMQDKWVTLINLSNSYMN